MKKRGPASDLHRHKDPARPLMRGSSAGALKVKGTVALKRKSSLTRSFSSRRTGINPSTGLNARAVGGLPRRAGPAARGPRKTAPYSAGRRTRGKEQKNRIVWAFWQKMQRKIAVLIWAVVSSVTKAYNNGLAQKPLLGWQSWCSVGVSLFIS